MKRLFLLAFIWGWSFLLIKVAVRGMTPTSVAAIRMALGAGVLLAVGRVRGLRIPPGARWWRHFAFVAVFGSALPFSLLAWGEQHISSALTSVLNASTPLFAALLAFAILRDRLSALQLAGLVLGFAGVAVVAGVGAQDVSGSSFGGAIAAVVAAAGYGLSFVYSRRHLVSLPPILAATGQLVAGAVVLAPVAIVSSVRDGAPTGTRSLLSVALLGVFGTGIAYVLSYRLIAEVGPTRAAAVTYVIPIVAVAVGIVFLQEQFSYRLAVGGALTAVGIFLLQPRNQVASAAVQLPADDERESGDE